MIACALITGFAITTPNPAEAKTTNVVKTAKVVEKWIKDSYCKKDSKCKRAAIAIMDKHCSRKWWEKCFFDTGRNGGKFKANGDRKWLVTGDFLDAKMKRQSAPDITLLALRDGKSQDPPSLGTAAEPKTARLGPTQDRSRYWD